MDSTGEGGRGSDEQPARGVRFRLIVTRPDGAVDTVEVGTAPIAVGRAEESDIQIDEARVSRHHCVIFSRAGRLNIQDQGSANGTYVNGEWVTHAPLSQGDEVLIGGTKVRVEVMGLAGLYGVALRRAQSSAPPPPPAEPAPLPASRAWPPRGAAVVRRLGALLSSSDDPRAAAEAAVALVLEAVPVDRAFVLVPGSGEEVFTVGSKQREGASGPVGEPSTALALRVLESGRPVYCLDVSSDQALSQLPELRAAEVAVLLVAPLSFEGDNLGVLYGDGLVLGAVSRDAIPIFEGVAEEAALALGRAKMHVDLASRHQKLSEERDQLERLVRTLEREVQHRVAQAEDQRLELALKVTELEHLREARQSLAQGMMQDAKTLVSSAQDKLAAVKGHVDDEEASKRLAEAVIDVERIVGVADDTVAVIQMEDGEYGLSTTPVPVEDMVQGALDRNASTARDLEIGLSGAAESPELTAIADRNVMARVIDNLIALAMNAAGRGGEVTVTAKEVSGRVELGVSESGPEAEPGERELHVERWARSTSTSARHLGASYHFCRLSVEAHGGVMRLEGDKGARRWVVSLPAREQDGFEDTLTS